MAKEKRTSYIRYIILHIDKSDSIWRDMTIIDVCAPYIVVNFLNGHIFMAFRSRFHNLTIS